MQIARILQLNNTGRFSARRILSMLLVFALLAQFVILPCWSVADAAASASSKGLLEMSAANVYHDETLTDNGDGTFTLSINLSVQGQRSDAHSDSHSTARNGYFTASHAGDYLVNLWGGNGAKAAGLGGKGGQVYGVVHLNKGDTLFYTLGGNGAETNSSTSGGGANGDGGAHGETGSVTVGGGGGYSAVFLFPAGSNFENSYLDSKGNIKVTSILESDRLNRYIMIAGGGGGGGGANGIGQASRPPSGGAGGTMDGGTAVEVSNGVYFAGGDGISSGSDWSYIGKGGTNVPGAVNDTFTDWGWFDGAQPNDWLGEPNHALDGGAGGAGNLRGGGGGGGYAGGSGGVQSSILWAANIGGGGGGSSFIHKTVLPISGTLDGVAYDYSDKVAKGNLSQTGGSVEITCVSMDDGVGEALSAFSVSGTVSQYFDIVNSTSNDFTISGDIHAKDITVNLTLQPKEDFTGGNNVPLLSSISCSMGSTPVALTLDSDCTHVNVPLNFSAIGNTYTTEKDSLTKKTAELYKDIYAEKISQDSTTTIRDYINNDNTATWGDSWQYDFIENISSYKVYLNGQEVTDSEVTVTETTKYTLAYEVTPSGGNKYAAVGKPTEGAQKISATATLIIRNASSVELGDVYVEYLKQLVANNDGTYTLSLRVNGIGPSAPYTEVTTQKPATMPDQPITSVVYGDSSSVGPHLTDPVSGSIDSTTQYTFTAPVEGYYLIQLWAATGGKSYSGASGAVGGYVYGYCKLTAKQTISVTVGNHGNTGSFFSRDGSSGKPSFATVGGAVVMIARGGDGGKRSGSPVASIVTGEGITSGSTDPAQYIGHAPNTSDAFNYRVDSMYATVSTLTDLTAEQQNTISTALNNAANNTRTNDDGVGEAKITCILPTGVTTTKELSDTEAKVTAAAAFADAFNIDLDISQYFTVVGTNGTDAYADGQTLIFTKDEDTTDGAVSFADIKPTVKTNSDDVAKECQSSVSFTVNVILKPKDGFLGGNDVPVLEESTFMAISQGENSANIAANPATDYANVALPNLTAANLSVKSDLIYILEHGYLLSESESLYSLVNFTVPSKDSLLDDYVTISDPALEEPTWTPTADDPSCLVNFSIAPIYPIVDATTGVKSSLKATVIDEVSAITISKPLTATVINRVNYDGLDPNLSTSHIPDGEKGYNTGLYLHPLDASYSAVLTADAGYKLPASITVICGSRTLTGGIDYTYDSTTGEIIIPAASINNQVIKISATADVYVPTYTIYFGISGDEPDKPLLSKTLTYEVGADLSEMDLTGTDNVPNILAISPEKEGHTFQWEWEGEGIVGAPDVKIPTTMPNSNQWVIGSFVPNEYELTVNYYKKDADGNETTESIADSYVGKVSYGSSYSVVSPTIAGWITDKPSVSGTMGASNLTIDVYYTQSTGTATIYYLFKEDDSQAAKPYINDKIYLNYSESKTSPVIEGFTADRSSVQIQVLDEDTLELGIVEYVYYTRDQYTVELVDPTVEGGTVYQTITVQYGKHFGYYSTDGGVTFADDAPLPTLSKTGYDFKGWSLDNPLEVEKPNYINEANLVNLSSTGTITLYANLQIQTFNVTVNYLYGDGTKAAESTYLTQAYDSDFTIRAPGYPAGTKPAEGDKYPELYGFIAACPTATKESGYEFDVETYNLTGKVPNRNLVIDIIYTGELKKLTIQYLDFNTGEAMPGMPTYVDDKVPYRSTYSVPSPDAPTGYHLDDQDTVVDGIMPNHDLVLTVYYKKNVEEVKVKVTVTWGELDFVYDYGTWNPDTHTYEGATITPPANNANTITIENDGDVSNINVYALLEYTGNTYYADMHGYFSSDKEGATRTDRTGEIAPGKTNIVWVWLEGTMPDNLWGQTLEAGRCTVTIRAGGKAQNNTSGGESS